MDSWIAISMENWEIRGCENNVYAFLIGTVPLGLSPSTFFRYAYILGEVLTGSIDQTKM